jgi:hypothetical protein
MNIGEVLDTVEQSLLSRQLSSLERFILCQSWLGRGYSEMASDCGYSIAHIKDIGSHLWQAFSKVLGERVTKKNLFLVLKQYLLSRIGETVNSDQLPVTFSVVEVIETPLTPTTNQLPVTTDFVEASYSGDSEQLSLVCERGFLVRKESLQLERGQQKCQSFTDNNDLKKYLLRALNRYEQSKAMTAQLFWASAKRCQIGFIALLINLPTFPT